MTVQYDPETGLQVLTKQPAESVLFDMDLVDRMRPGDTIASIVSGFPAQTNMGKVPGSSDVSFGSSLFSGTIVQMRISAGQHLEHYKITVRVNTVGGDIIEGDGMLYVDNS